MGRGAGGRGRATGAKANAGKVEIDIARGQQWHAVDGRHRMCKINSSHACPANIADGTSPERIWDLPPCCQDFQSSSSTHVSPIRGDHYTLCLPTLHTSTACFPPLTRARLRAIFLTKRIDTRRCMPHVRWRTRLHCYVYSPQLSAHGVCVGGRWQEYFVRVFSLSAAALSVQRISYSSRRSLPRELSWY